MISDTKALIDVGVSNYLNRLQIYGYLQISVYIHGSDMAIPGYQHPRIIPGYRRSMTVPTVIESIEQLSDEAAQRGLHASVRLGGQPTTELSNTGQTPHAEETVSATGTLQSKETEAFI